VDSYSIGISGLDAAQKALDIIGNNVANAATEGYHRQRIELTPERTWEIGDIILGGGVDIEGVIRLVDTFLEQEMLRQQSLLGQVSQELSALRTVENAFAELSGSGGLSAVIDEFFNALQDLSAHPAELIWQSQVLTAAQTMAGQFRTLAGFLNDLETQIKLEAANTIEQINSLATQIAALNAEIQRAEITGGQANNLRDHRDRCITEMSELIAVETRVRDFGVVDVSIGGMPAVTGTTPNEFEVGLKEDGSFGISVAGAHVYNTGIQGGRLGGLLSLTNDILPEVRGDLDTLASVIIQQMNQYHVQGVGSEGSFSTLTGWVNASGNLSDFSTVSAGYIYIRVTTTGTVTRTPVPVLQGASSDTLAEIATYITNNVANVSASVDSSTNKLAIMADADYKFDFIPAVLPEPEADDIHFNGSEDPTVSVSGIYTGTANDTFEFKVVGDGLIGDDGLQLEVRDGGGSGDLIATLNIGSGYAAGDKLDVGNGIKISLGTGDLANGDSFSIHAFADTDTSGVLAAVGINTFFSGSGAADIAVCSDISNSPARIATALGPDMTDNTNALRFLGLKDQTLSSLDGLTPIEFYRQLVADIGQDLSVAQMREDNIEVIIQNLASQQSEISGVNINDEAARMLVFEQMFQAMAKYLNTVNSCIATMMDLI
jgi:flagellar hook-associated protein 1 FlgK